MTTITRWGRIPAHFSTLQDQVNKLFEGTFNGQGENSAITSWAPAVDIYETENELVLKADLPGVSEKDIDVRVENNMLTVRGERQFETKVKEDNYLRRAHLWLVQPQLRFAEHGQHRSH
jgi:HSP20 family molecular chaperone IbpA